VGDERSSSDHFLLGGRKNTTGGRRNNHSFERTENRNARARQQNVFGWNGEASRFVF
jgi:hypothetical protein